jgi:hypothetical protein
LGVGQVTGNSLSGVVTGVRLNGADVIGFQLVKRGSLLDLEFSPIDPAAPAGP